MWWNFEPLRNLLDVGNGGTHSHDSDFVVDTHDSTDDSFKNGASVFHVEHVNFIDQEKVEFFEKVEVFPRDVIDFLRGGNINVSVAEFPGLHFESVTSQLHDRHCADELFAPGLVLFMAKTLDWGQVQTFGFLLVHEFGDHEFKKYGLPG
jgi:hypothetical protein